MLRPYNRRKIENNAGRTKVRPACHFGCAKAQQCHVDALTRRTESRHGDYFVRFASNEWRKDF
jgi:hypothetical protein